MRATTRCRHGHMAGMRAPPQPTASKSAASGQPGSHLLTRASALAMEMDSQMSIMQMSTASVICRPTL
jgi:hypothetical protein